MTLEFNRNPKSVPVFHLAFPVKDVESTREFYVQKLGFAIDLAEKNRCIINFFGHQLVAHVSESDIPEKVAMYPRHFGVILEKESDFEELLAKAKASKVEFFQEAFTRFPDSPRAHRTFFLKDPSNNLIEFKWYKNIDLITRAT